MDGQCVVDAILSSRKQLLLLDETDDGCPRIMRAVPGPVPLVSVEVLACNQGKYLRQCVESIVCQKTDFPFEVIIGNDCSEDDTQSVAEKLQQEHPDKITIVTTTRNVGLNRNARNVRRLMRGEFAAFCEGDDWWVGCDRLQKQVDYLRAHPEVSLLHGLSAFFDERTGAMRESHTRYRLPRKRFWRVFDETYRIETASVACRVRDLVRIYDECPQLIGSRYRMLDTKLFCLLASSGEVRHFEEVLSVRRLTGTSLSQNRDLVKTMRYHDNAFQMKMAICDHFKVGFWPRFRSENFYLLPALRFLADKYGWRDAARLGLRLYPHYRTRIWLMCAFRQPRNAFLRKVYNHFVFSTVKYRNAFG